jgi:SAM-dependent methyltransferase
MLRHAQGDYSILPYAITIFVSAFLLFQVQLLLAKAILPWFGGAASVWTTCMLFFQTLLLIGYSYAHWLAQRPRLATQGRIHLLALVLSVVALGLTGLTWGIPLLADGSWKPEPDNSPVWHILVLLGVTVGLPYLVLSATGPLLQSWFSARKPGQSPYRLYALSNLGSLLGLLTYPFLIEVFVPLRGQAWVWTAGYALFTAGMGWIAWRLTQAGLVTAPALSSSATDNTPRPTVRQRLLWLALPACASVLLLAITNQMSQEIAVNPFLWMLPLCLYLTSFILCFDNERWYWRELYLFLLIPALALTTLVLVGGLRAAALAQIFILSGALFIVCMVCHGELVRLKPTPRYLTAFYLTLTAGGAMGGVFVGLIAPAFFKGFFELPFALWFTAALLFAILWQEPASPLRRLPAAAATAAFATAVVLVGLVFSELLPDRDDSTLDAFLAASLLPTGLVVGALLILAYLIWNRRSRQWLQTRPVRQVWLASLLVFGLAQFGVAVVPLSDATFTARNFFGVVQVLEEQEAGSDAAVLSLRHGRILHGIQYMDEARRHELGAYYHPRSGIGLAILQHPRRENAGPMHIGVIGLGAGMLAAYGRAGDRLRFYEIDPQVIRLAASPDAPFTYVRDTAAHVKVVIGDARLALEAELGRNSPQQFDVLAVDAFSSDSIPMHLLTREALALYLAHLAPDGILAIHVSNRYLDLAPIVWRLAEDARLAAAVIESDGARANWHSIWVLLTRDTRTLQTPAITRAATKEIPPQAPLWRDDYSNLFQAMQFTSSSPNNPLEDF